MTFEPLRALLNPNFDSYKLKSEAVSVCASQALPAAAGTGSASDSQLSWKDLRSRARWNGLVASESAKETLWIEAATNEVWLANFDSAEGKTRKFFDIPPVVSYDSSADELPTLATCGSVGFALSDGHGSLHVISPNGVHLSAAHLIVDSEPRSFKLHACDASSSTALLSLHAPREGGSKTPAVFEVVVVRLPADGELDHGPLHILKRFRGDDLPSYVHCIDGEWVVGSDSPLVPFPPLKEEQFAEEEEFEKELKPSAAYRWTQTADSVDIDVPDLPATLKASDFKISFSPEYITLLISHADAARFVHRNLWAPVDAGACTWAWEADAQLLSLHLEKKHVGTRWSTLFSQVPDEGEVAETLSDEQLADISASLDKYTAETEDLLDFESRAGLLGEDGEDVDEEASADTTVSTLLASGKTGERVSVVSEALPVCGRAGESSLLVKRSYDGLLYTPSIVQGDLKWTHSTTYPALAFVLASKRNIRFRFHSDISFALALDGGGLPISSGAPGANAYVYWPPAPGKRDRTATQAVVNLAGAVCRGAVAIDEDRVTLLCEGQLKILSGLAHR